MSRPTKATPKLVDELCRYLEAGVPKANAAASCGIDRSTLFNWENSDSALSARLLRARAKGLVNLHFKGLAGGRGSACALSMLERLDPAHYSLRMRLEHTGKDGGPIASRIAAGDMSQYSDEELRRIAAGE